MSNKQAKGLQREYHWNLCELRSGGPCMCIFVFISTLCKSFVFSTHWKVRA